MLAFVPVGEFDVEDFVDAPRYEAGAFTLVEASGVDVVLGIARVLVRIVVASTREEFGAGVIAGIKTLLGLWVDCSGEGYGGSKEKT